MDLGTKLRNARVEAGLSQRELCGDRITRNMLSQIEHGTATPSMNTLRYLAQRLEKPVSFFLDEAPDLSALGRTVGILDQAREAIVQEKYIYAQELLDQADTASEALRRQALLLRARLPGADLARICAQLPSLDEELLLRAGDALDRGECFRAAHLLEAAEKREGPAWNLLRGRVWLAMESYEPAAACFHRLEEQNPAAAAPWLEICYRELGDFRKAYEYACAQKR